jgi:hypothetical protein
LPDIGVVQRKRPSTLPTDPTSPGRSVPVGERGGDWVAAAGERS